MKIIHTSGSLEEEASGPSYSIPATAKATQSLGHDVHVMSVDTLNSKANSTLRTDAKLGYTHHRFPHNFGTVPVLKSFNASRQMKKRLATARADIIHNHGLWLSPNIYASEISRKYNIPLVITPRGMLAPQALKYSAKKKAIFSLLFQNRALQTADLYHATSEQEYQDIRQRGLKQPVIIIPNGINLPSITQQKMAETPESTQKTLLFLGRIHPIKGLDNLINAWSRIESIFPNWTLIMKGPGDQAYISSLKQKTSDLNLKNVTLSNGVFGEEKIMAYRSADIYILPSKSENFGMTVAEALSVGTPVICTNGAPWSGLKTHKCGWWIEQDTNSLEACLRQALQTPPQTLKGMGQAGRDWMEKDFTWANIAQQLESAYLWLLGQGEQPKNIYRD